MSFIGAGGRDSKALGFGPKRLNYFTSSIEASKRIKRDQNWETSDGNDYISQKPTISTADDLKYSNFTPPHSSCDNVSNSHHNNSKETNVESSFVNNDPELSSNQNPNKNRKNFPKKSDRSGHDDENTPRAVIRVVGPDRDPARLSSVGDLLRPLIVGLCEAHDIDTWEPGGSWAQLCLEVWEAGIAADPDCKPSVSSVQRLALKPAIIELVVRVVAEGSSGTVTQHQAMDFIANLHTSGGPRTGFTQDNLEWLEKLFRTALGTKQELSCEDFKKIVLSRNSFFAERVFQIFDRDKSGTVSLSEFLSSMQQFAGQSPNDKFKFLFRIYDLDGDGLIQQSELQQVMQACMEENGMRFSQEQIQDLTLALFEDADTDQQGEITYEELKAQLEKHDGLLENLSISIDRWLVPPKPTDETPTFIKRLHTLKPYQLTLPYIKNNYVYLTFLFIYCLINTSLFISRAVEYKDHNGFTIIARACGQCLNFNVMFTLVLMLRQTLTFLRTNGAGSFLPLDQHLYFHKLVGWVIFFLSTLHTLMHVLNFATILVYHTELEGANEFSCSLGEMFFTDCPQKWGLVEGWANPIGFILIVVLYIMVICSQAFVRKGGYFEVFYWTHSLYVAFFVLTILHGPNFWKWMITPGVIFLIEKTYRGIKTRTGSGKTFISSGVLLPSKVTNLVIQRPNNFHFHPGDYVFVNIPAIAKYEWHPFTVSSAPEQEGAIWLHIRAVGEWTNRLHSYFDSQQQRCTSAVQKKPSNVIFKTTHAVDGLKPPNKFKKENVPMLAITEEDSNKPESVSPTRLRKFAYVNKSFEDTESINLKSFPTSDKPQLCKSPTNDSGILSESPSIASFSSTNLKTTPPKKLGPQKVQSTPNFFSNRNTIPPKRILDRSTSSPNFYKKHSISKENDQKSTPNLSSQRRTTSEMNFNEATLAKAREIAAQEAKYQTNADKSVVQSYRYMRVKPRVITLDMPADDGEDLPPTTPTPQEHLNVSQSGMRKRSAATVITVDESAGAEAQNSLTVPGSKENDQHSRGKRESRRTRRVSRLEEAEAMGACVGEQLEIYIDGPYGTPSSHIFRAQHAVLIGTGIGVTPFASILQSIMFKYWKARHTCPSCEHSWTSSIPTSVMNLRKVDFFWINRDQRSFEWFVNLLSQLEIEQAEQGGVMDRFLDMHMYITSALQKTDMKAVGLQLALDLLHEKGKRDLITGLKTRTNAGRPNWDKVLAQLARENKGRITVFYCGPPALGRVLRRKCDEHGFEFRKEIF